MFLKKVSPLLTTCLLPLSVTAIELTDYSDPDSFYDEAKVTANFNLNSGNQDQTSFDANAIGEYDLIYSTLPLTWGMEFDGKLDISRGSADNSSTQKGYDFFWSGDVNKYFNPSNDFLGYGAIDLGYRRSKGAGEADDPYAKLGGGVGYGRVINATPLAKIMRIVEELVEYGVIIKPLSDQAYLDLAKVVAQESQYKSNYGLEDYKLPWIGALEKILQKEGVLKDNTLGTIGTLKIDDVLFKERISIRKHGWLAKAGLGFVVSSYDGSDSDPSLDASFEYALPLSHRFQYLELAEYSTLLADDVVHKFRNKMSTTYEVSDRIDWENKWIFDVSLPSDSNANDLIVNDLTSTFRYYISHLITADFTIGVSHTEDDIDNNGNDDWETSVFMGLTYWLR
jgi:hypothetical protein